VPQDDEAGAHTQRRQKLARALRPVQCTARTAAAAVGRGA
jgi:hypothetical protein